MHDSRGKRCGAGEQLVSLYVLRRNLYDPYALLLLFVPMQTCCKVVSHVIGDSGILKSIVFLYSGGWGM